MKRKAIIAALAAIALCGGTLRAQDFFDTSGAEKLFTIGARVGFNTSNQTSPSEGLEMNLDSWGTGFTAGAVFDIAFRDYLAIQPGVFFESRSHNYSYVDELPQDIITACYGHTRSTWLKMPVMASVRMHPSSQLQWAVEAGPVFGFGMGGSDKCTLQTASPERLKFKTGYFDTRKKWSFGWKLGTTLRYASHYLIGVHYEAGTSQVYKDLKHGRHKAWTFTLGYDF